MLYSVKVGINMIEQFWDEHIIWLILADFFWPLW